MPSSQNHPTTDSRPLSQCWILSPPKVISILTSIIRLVLTLCKWICLNKLQFAHYHYFIVPHCMNRWRFIYPFFFRLTLHYFQFRAIKNTATGKIFVIRLSAYTEMLSFLFVCFLSNFSLAVYENSLCSTPFLHQHLESSVSLISTTTVYWYSIVILMCFPDDCEHLFIYLLATCVKCPDCFSTFLWRVFFVQISTFFKKSIF